MAPSRVLMSSPPERFPESRQLRPLPALIFASRWRQRPLSSIDRIINPGRCERHHYPHLLREKTVHV